MVRCPGGGSLLIAAGFCLQVTLNNGMEMPLVGFGTAGLGPDTKQAVKWALEAGYRLLDSAQVCSAPLLQSPRRGMRLTHDADGGGLP